MPIRYEWTPEQQQQAEAANQWLMDAIAKAMPGSAYLGQETYQPLAQPIANAVLPKTLEDAMNAAFNTIGVGPLLVKGSDPIHPEWIEAAINKFGLTDNPYQAGYIVPSGKMLNFGGVGKWARNIDHTEINRLIPEVGEFPKNTNWWGTPSGPDKFTDITNSIRMSVMPEGGPLWVSMSKVPNKYQLKTIKESLPYVRQQYPGQPSIIADLVNMTEPTRPRTTGNEFRTFPEFISWLENKFGK